MRLISTLLTLRRSTLLTTTSIRTAMSASVSRKRALVILAPGVEELEFVTSVDILRRGGVDVTVAAVATDESPVRGAHDICMLPNVSVHNVDASPYDAVVLPGGLGGTKAMAASVEVGKILKQHETCGKIIAAICAAPIALKSHCIGFGKNITSYPAMEAEMNEGASYKYKQENVVVDGTLITSRGPGTAALFALTLVEHLVDRNKACAVAKGMLIDY